MPRCNLTLKQKTQLIELSEHLSTGQLAKKFRVHATTVTRTIKKKERILNQASRVNPNFKTVQTNLRSEEHDTMVLDYIRSKQGANIPISVTDICDKAIEIANLLGREIKSRRAWWRRFRIRCNVVRQKLGPQESQKSSDEDERKVLSESPKDKASSPKKVITLPTINLPKPLNKLDDEIPKNLLTDSTKDEDITKNDPPKTNKDAVKDDISEINNDVNAKDSCSLNEEVEPLDDPRKETNHLKDRKPRKNGRSTKKGRKKKGKNSSVINFTFKIKKTPSKGVSVK